MQMERARMKQHPTSNELTKLTGKSTMQPATLAQQMLIFTEHDDCAGAPLTLRPLQWWVCWLLTSLVENLRQLLLHTRHLQLEPASATLRPPRTSSWQHSSAPRPMRQPGRTGCLRRVQAHMAVVASWDLLAKARKAMEHYTLKVGSTCRWDHSATSLPLASQPCPSLRCRQTPKGSGPQAFGP